MKTIIDTAIDAGKFTTFLAALKAASLMDTLRTPGPYTIFAPTDAAFARLAPGTLKSLLKDVRRLKVMLTLHIVSGTFSMRSFTPGDVKTVEGRSLLFASQGHVTSINGALFEQADISCSNGFIHAIDTVILTIGGNLPAVA